MTFFKKPADKKEETYSYFHEEINKINGYISENNLKKAAERFYNAVLTIFADILGISSQVTYEEIIHRLCHLEDNLGEINNNIKNIQEKIEQEYAQKNKVSANTIKKNIEELHSKLNMELDKEKEYLRLNKLLSENNFKEALAYFIKWVSDLKYSEREPPKAELMDLINTFENIVLHMLGNKEKKIENKLHSISSTVHRSLNIFKIRKILKAQALLKRADAEMHENRINNAKLTYLKILALYCKMSNKDRGVVFKPISELFERLKSK